MRAADSLKRELGSKSSGKSRPKGWSRFRRARSLLISWRDGDLVFTNYLARTVLSGEPETVRVLNFCDDWVRLPDLVAHMPEYSRRSIASAVRQLIATSLLVIEHSAAAVRDADLADVWSAWLPHGSFHFATKDVYFLTPSETEPLMKRYMAESPQPALTKQYRGSPSIPLSKTHSRDDDFSRVLMARQTYRNFARKPISLAMLSDLLYYTWGVTGKIDAPPFGRLFHKTSPSGGARHSIEAYVLALRVEGLSQGLYHYDGLKQKLTKIRGVQAKKKAVEYTAGHEFLDDASALFIMTAVFPRVLWKYRFARGYRVVLLDAGHLCQTFCLAATWLGLAPFCTAALQDSLIEKDLGIDGIRESVLYVAAVGVPVAGKARNNR